MNRIIPQSYIESVQRTVPADLIDEEKKINFGLSFFEEVGEVIGVLKKHIWHGHELNKQKLTEEIGDVLWYFVALETIKKNKVQNQISVFIYKTYDIIRLLSQILNNTIDNKQNTLNIMFSIGDYFCIDVTEIIEFNINKLQKRYPDGFSKDKSINRVI